MFVCVFVCLFVCLLVYFFVSLYAFRFPCISFNSGTYFDVRGHWNHPIIWTRSGTVKGYLRGSRGSHLNMIFDPTRVAGGYLSGYQGPNWAYLNIQNLHLHCPGARLEGGLKDPIHHLLPIHRPPRQPSEPPPENLRKKRRIAGKSDTW